MVSISNLILIEMADDEEIQKLGWNIQNIQHLSQATDKVLRFAFIYNEYTHENYSEKAKVMVHIIAKYINELIENEQYTPYMTGMGCTVNQKQDFINEAFHDFEYNLEIEEKYIRPSRYDKDTLNQNDFKHIFPQKLPVVIEKRRHIIKKNTERMEKTLESWIKDDLKNTFISNPNLECTQTFKEHCVNQKRK